MKYALISDGSSERALIPILSWCLRRNGVRDSIDPAWADLRRVPRPPRELVSKITLASQLYPCGLLFVHRDAEGITREERSDEISRALTIAATDRRIPPAVRVVPVRMMEAWLLHDEGAIRAAADNPRGRVPLGMPETVAVEGIADPKRLLHGLLIRASGLNVRRRRSLKTGRLVHRIAELTGDFSALDSLPAFVRFNADLSEVLREHGAAFAAE